MLLINKKPGPTSHDIVDEIRKLTKEKRVGHAGTLDPFAEGLLIVLVGREETRKQAEFLNMDKTYEAVFILGEERDTDDITGRVRDAGTSETSSRVSQSDFSSENPPLPLSGKSRKSGNQAFPLPRATRDKVSEVLALKEIKNALKRFEGEIEQMPPAYSAKKIKGKKAYELARRGKEPKLHAKRVKIYEIKLLNYTWPELKIRTTVSSGTYIRALARDIGRELGVGAYVKELKRTHIGKYSLDEAKTLEELKK
ncbi:MAG: tRNA pseudouridine(55) synthase TruB [Candidatus Spechtbacterales bacterium]